MGDLDVDGAVTMACTCESVREKIDRIEREVMAEWNEAQTEDLRLVAERLSRSRELQLPTPSLLQRVATWAKAAGRAIHG